MSNNNSLIEKIDNVFNLLDNEQVLKSDVILQLCDLIQTNDAISLPEDNKQKLLNVIKKNLQTSNTELQRDSLTLLCHCFDHNLFDKEQLVSELFIIVIDGVFKKKLENLEDQELWLKVLDTILKITNELTPFILEHSVEILEAIKIALASKISSSPKKLPVLKLLSNMISKIELNERNTNELLIILFTILIPSLFNESTRHFTITLDMAYKIISKIPYSTRKADQNWHQFTRNQFATIYEPFMIKMVLEEKLMYCQLWKFCLKIIDKEILTNSSLINTLLGVLEKAFKAKNMALRKEAFMFWQYFIRCFLNSTTNKIPTQKIKLLTIPLTSNISKTNELFFIKYETWCILLNTIHKLSIYPNEFQGILGDFLTFSFSPTTPGKKMPNLHLKMCENFFKIIATNDLVQNYTPVKSFDIVCDNGMVTPDLFVQLRKKIVNSVEEASILLNNCLENEKEAQILNKLLWEALFVLCENALKNNESTFSAIIQEMHDLILRITEVSDSSKQKVNSFCVETILNLVVSGKYHFCLCVIDEEKTMFELIFSKLFQDIKSFYTLSNSATFLEIILTYKEKQSDQLENIDKFLNQIKNLGEENSTDHALTKNLFKSWIVLENEISKILTKNKNNIPKNMVNTFQNLMLWAIENINFVSKTEKVLEIWKKNLENFIMNNDEKKVSVNTMCSIFSAKVLEKDDFALTSSKILFIIISKLNFKKGIYEESKKELAKILQNLKNITSKTDLGLEIVENLKKSVDFIFLNCSSKMVIVKILPTLIEIVQNLLTNYPETNLTETIETFTKTYKPNEKTKPLLQDLVKLVFKNKTESFKAYFEDSANQNLIDDGKNSVEDKIVVAGVNINTMTPVKLKGSILNNIETPKGDQKQQEGVAETKTGTLNRKKEPSRKPMDDEFIFVNTPYTFNPKKLTKSQKQKLSRRREDIPAMYNDLSQSQTMEFSESSNFEDSQINSENANTISLSSDDDITKLPKRAFSEVNNSNIENTEPEATNEDSFKINMKRELQKLAMSNIMGFEEHLKISATTPTRYTRNRILSTKKEANNSLSPTKSPSHTPEQSPNTPTLKRGCPKGSLNKEKKRQKTKNETISSSDIIESSQNSEMGLSQSQSSPDLLTDTTKENISVSPKKKQALLEDLGVKIKKDSDENRSITIKLNTDDPLNSDGVTTDISKSNKVLRVLLEEPCIIQRRNSLESASLENNLGDPLVNSANSLVSNKRKRKNSLKDDENLEEDFNKRKVPKIKLLRSPNEEKSFVIENNVAAEPEKMDTDTCVNENEKETESISSEIFNDIPQDTVEYPNANNSICRKVLFEKCTDSDETNLETSLERAKSSPKEPQIEIVTSPLRHDTPTRNKEFLENTLEISPIKNSSSRNITLDFEQKEDGTKSPDLFSDNPPKEIVISECLTPTLQKRKNKFGSKSRDLSRGAQMMNLINPNGSCIKNENNTPNKDCDTPNLRNESRVATPIISNSRISKMMVQFDNKNMDKIEENSYETPTKNQPENEEDFLKFTKQIPLPSASPRFGILRKDGISPGTRQKRVNFNDPPFTCLKFVEKYHQNKITKIDQQDTHTELSLLTSLERNQTVKTTSIEINGITEETEYCDIYQNISKEDGIQSLLLEPNRKPTEEREEDYVIETESPQSPEQKADIIDETNSEILTQEEVARLYKKHTECPELLSSCLNQTTQNEKLISVLKDVNIKTVGEFAKFVIEDSKILTLFTQIKQILDNHNCDDHTTKIIRKIKPTMLSSPKKPSSSSMMEVLSASSSENSPNTLEKNITESQGKILNTLETQSSEVLNQICSTQGGSSNTLDWNKLFCNIIGADQFVKLLLLQESSRDANFVSIVKFIVNYSPRKFTETILELISTSKLLKNEFHHNFLPGLLKILGINCLKNVLTLGELQGLFLGRLRADSETTELDFFNSTDLFDSILRFSPKNIQSFIPKILENPTYNSCIIKNLSLFELQEHLIEKLSKDTENKEAFLNRLNEKLGNKLKIVNDSSCTNEIISDSLESTSKSTCTLESSLDLIKSLYLDNISSNDWLVLKSISDTINNLFYTHLTFKK